MNNFKCKNGDCNHEFFISEFYTKDDLSFFDKYKKEIKCSKCDSKVSYVKKQNEFGIPMFGSDSKQKIQQFKQISKQHFKKEIAERKRQLDLRRDINTD